MDIGEAVEFITTNQAALLDQIIIAGAAALTITVVFTGLFVAWRFFMKMI